MGSWLKIFTDGSHELGSDSQIKSGKASWTRGKLTDIEEVQLATSVMLASLSVPNTNWYQFDHFTAEVTGDTPVAKRILRVVQAEIKKSHVGMYLTQEMSSIYVFTVTMEKTDTSHSAIITDDMVGKWATLMLPEKSLPCVALREKGKF